MCLVIPCVSLGRDHAAHTGPHGGKVTVWGSAGQQEGRSGPRPHIAPLGSSGETRGYKWVHFNQKKYLSYCRSLLQHLILCLSSFFPECRVKRQSNPCWLDHNHMWLALVWSLSIGSSFMSMSTAFKKLQASNCKVYKVRPFLTKDSPVCRVPAQHKKWVSVSGSMYQMYQMLEMSRHDLYSLSSEHLAPQSGAPRASTASAEPIKPFITIATIVAIGLNRWSSGDNCYLWACPGSL